MNSLTLKGHELTVALHLALSLLGSLASGCAAPPGGTSVPKSGSGIAEYRQLTREAHRSVAATMKSLEALAQPSTRTSTPHPALPSLDRALKHLELTSIRTRARADAIMARGQAYFDEWKEQLGAAGRQPQPPALPETHAHARLLEHFGRVRQRSAAVRELFGPFMAKLREFRARFDQPSAPTVGGAFREELAGLIATGRGVLQSLESVSTALDEAEAEMRVTAGSRR